MNARCRASRVLSGAWTHSPITFSNSPDRPTMGDPRVLVITGTRKGIGRYLAEYYCDAGDLVVGCSRKASDWRHRGYLHHCLDVTEEAGVKEMFLDVSHRFGRLDGLIK